MLAPSPVAKLKVEQEEAMAFTEDYLKSLGYVGHTITSTQLEFHPFWVFNYGCYYAKDATTGEKKLVNKEGKAVLDAISSELNEDMAKNVANSQLVDDVPETWGDKFVPPVITKDEAMAIAQQKLGIKLGVTPEDIVTTGIQNILVPVWRINGSYEAGGFSMNILGISLKLISTDIKQKEEKKKRVKVLEIIQKILFDPARWAELTKALAFLVYRGAVACIDIVHKTFNIFTKTELGKKMIVYIVALIVVVILLQQFKAA